ncbi:hypothetical protein SNOG_10244 [Parastagonospora nodorum SN15]|uniref:Uncharacterized protein n=1 Tax=Phaeosphaeria nodorum (strain SN15 / ATCC MYA-4574 / FGSC 10173) TaxID=321614 RepID=Q0UDC0_PHANO|nr:hypothetical protein SNOG_10244 [Parastagonospora nodorum SN15]EAT82579.1 hypothetical protein SNOG_10244 [Parastagonospora nodorum SN15]
MFEKVGRTHLSTSAEWEGKTKRMTSRTVFHNADPPRMDHGFLYAY